MHHKNNRKLLQLFADGAEGQSAEASTTGEESAVAGHTQLQEELPPADRAQQTGQDAAAEETGGDIPRMTWEQIKADPEYSACMQAMVRQRLKHAKQAQEDLQTLAPVLEHLARNYGLDWENPDYSALAEAVAGQNASMQTHYESLVQQAQALKQRFPDFDLHRELAEPTFARLTAPNVGISLEDAYYTVHRKEIQAAALQVTAQQTARRISNAIRSGYHRPRENGTAATAPSVTAFDYANASRQQREALKTRIREAGARGEKLYPGSF